MIWGIAGGVTAVALETAYRLGLSWHSPAHVPVAVLGGLTVTYCVWRVIVLSPTYLSAIVWFGATTALVRIGIAFLLLNEPLSWKSAVATGALVVAAAARFL